MFQPDQTIMRDGDKADELLILTRGTVDLSICVSGEEVFVMTVEGPAILGEPSASSGKGQPYTVQPKTFCDCRSVFHMILQPLLARFPDARASLERETAKRVQGCAK